MATVDVEAVEGREQLQMVTLPFLPFPPGPGGAASRPSPRTRTALSSHKAPLTHLGSVSTFFFWRGLFFLFLLSVCVLFYLFIFYFYSSGINLKEGSWANSASF